MINKPTAGVHLHLPEKNGPERSKISRLDNGQEEAAAKFGGAIPAWIMDAYGYVPNVPQTATSLKGIEL